jgi:molybdate transport system regulatory protein
MPRLTLRIDFDEDRAIGPGKMRLLELIDKHGSISEAGRQMADVVPPRLGPRR